MPARISHIAHSRLKRIKLFLCDVDGVLTDGSVFIGGAREIKRFNIRDGLGLVFLRRAGFKVGWVSAGRRRRRKCARRELKIDFLIQQGDRIRQDRRGRKTFAPRRNWIGTRFVLLATTSWIWARCNARAFAVAVARRRARGEGGGAFRHARGGRPRRGARSGGNDFESAGEMGCDHGALPRNE